MKIGACYIRVSTADQTEFSPDSQLRMILEYAAKNEIVISEEHIYKDEGISGRTVEKRPSFQKMIAAAKQKAFEVILVYSTSRFARNHEQSIVYRSMLEREYDVSVISITQPNIDKKTDMLTSAIYSIMDEWYSMDLADNVKRGMTEKALRGEYQTIAPLGYERKHKGAVLSIKEDEAETIKTVFNMFLSGKSTWKISRELNASNITTKNGHTFEKRYVVYILRNPVYKGYSRWTPTGKLYHDFKNKDSIIVKGQHEPIIDETSFERVQRMLDEQEAVYTKKSRPRETLTHWLSSMIKCSDCGKSLVYASVGAKSTNKQPYFRCGGYARGKCKTANHLTVPAAEKVVISFLSSISRNIDVLYTTNIEFIDDNPEKLSQKQAELKRLDAKLTRAKEGFLNGVFAIDEFKNLKNDCEKKIEVINKEIISIKQKKVDYESLQKDIINVSAILSSGNFDITEKQTAIRSVLSRIVFDKKAWI